MMGSTIARLGATKLHAELIQTANPECAKDAKLAQSFLCLTLAYPAHSAFAV
jgi:hypothetical protein